MYLGCFGVGESKPFVPPTHSHTHTHAYTHQNEVEQVLEGEMRAGRTEHGVTKVTRRATQHRRHSVSGDAQPATGHGVWVN